MNDNCISDTFVVNSPADCDAILTAFYNKFPSVKPQTDIDVLQSLLDQAQSTITSLKQQLETEKKLHKEVKETLKSVESDLVKAKKTTKVPKTSSKDIASKDKGSIVTELNKNITILQGEIKQKDDSLRQMSETIRTNVQELSNKAKELAAFQHSFNKLHESQTEKTAAAVRKAVKAREDELKKDHRAALQEKANAYKFELEQLTLKQSDEQQKKDEELAAMKKALITVTEARSFSKSGKRSRNDIDADTRYLQQCPAAMQQQSAAPYHVRQSVAPQPQQSVDALLQALQQQQQQQSVLSQFAPMLQLQQVPQIQHSQLFAPHTSNTLPSYYQPNPMYQPVQQATLLHQGPPSMQQAPMLLQQAPLSHSALNFNQMLHNATVSSQQSHQSMAQLLADARRGCQQSGTTTCSIASSSNTSNDSQMGGDSWN